MTRARDIANFGDGIATADIDDGAVTAAKIGAGAITSAALPSGSVLQVVTVSPDLNQVAHTAGTFAEVSTSFRASITPINASSTLLIRCTFQFGGRNSTILSHFKIYDITNSADVNLPTLSSRTKAHGSARQGDADTNDIDMMSLEAIVSAGSTTARTYGMYSQNEQSSTIQKFFFASDTDNGNLVIARPVFTIFEIAP